MKKICVVAVCGVLALVLAVPGGIADGKPGETRVVCIVPSFAVHPFGRLTKGPKPENCTFHHRHTPLAESFFIETKDDHWRVWGLYKAQGHGTWTSGMGGATERVRIRLFDPER